MDIKQLEQYLMQSDLGIDAKQLEHFLSECDLDDKGFPPEELVSYIRRQIYDFKRLMAYYRCAIMEIETKFNVINEDFSYQYERNPIESIKSRLKEPTSIRDKLARRGLAFSAASIEENLFDVAGVRVVCSFVDDVYRIADALVQQDDITLIRRKDYIANPKENGYRSLHLIVAVPIFLTDQKKTDERRDPAAHHRHGFLGKPGTSNPLQSQPRSPGLCSWRTARVCGHHLPDRPKDAAPFQADPLYGGQKGLGQRADSFRRKISSPK